jgi:hypothetical protein
MIPTPETQRLRNEWYRVMDFCCPEHNSFHAQHCLLCQRLLKLQFEREAVLLTEIYRLEREAERLIT